MTAALSHVYRWYNESERLSNRTAKILRFLQTQSSRPQNEGYNYVPEPVYLKIMSVLWKDWKELLLLHQTQYQFVWEKIDEILDEVQLHTAP
jgi:hypothetical protein